jgi:hypothetical protein
MGEFDNREREEVFSKKVRAGKRTYFFDVKATRSNDYYVTITESKKRLEDGVFIKHKIFLYKEDFEKFAEGLKDTVEYIKANQDVVEKRYEYIETPEVATTTATDDDFSFEIWTKQAKLIIVKPAASRFYFLIDFLWLSAIWFAGGQQTGAPAASHLVPMS